MSDNAQQQLLHLVIGGELIDLEHNIVKNLDEVDIVGVYPNYATAHAASSRQARSGTGERIALAPSVQRAAVEAHRDRHHHHDEQRHRPHIGP